MSFASALKGAFRQPAFVGVVLLLAVCAATLNTAAGYLKLHFKKLPVPMRVKSLKEGIPANLGHWVMVSVDQPIDGEVQQVLGTAEYVFRDYVDDRLVTQDQIETIRDSTGSARDELVSRLQTQKPSAVIRAAVTYYTGIVDTVAHVPERCYIADGFDVKEREEHHVTLGNYSAVGNGDTPKARDVDYRFLSFEDQAGTAGGVRRVARNVSYLFHCNGMYTSDPLKVRGALQNLFEPYGYYAKVELMTAAPLRFKTAGSTEDANRKQDSVNAMEDFYAELLPRVESCLPDWQALHGK